MELQRLSKFRPRNSRVCVCLFILSSCLSLFTKPVFASFDMGDSFENEDSSLGADILFSTKAFLRKKNTLPPPRPTSNQIDSSEKSDKDVIDSATYPIKVYIELHVESIRDIAGDATMDLYMIETWNDWREAGKENRSLKMSGKGTVNFCWIPDTYFILARSIYYSPSSQSLTVAQDGNVSLDRKIRLVTPCTPEVWYFPFDVTTCKILISSYGYTDTEMDLFWQETGNNGIDFPFEYEPLSEMGFKMISMSTCKYPAPYDNSNFTILEGQIQLKRLFSVYIYQIYIPAALLVILSWVSFWINRNATPARASVGVTTVLTMLTLATQSQQNMEKHITLETSLLDVYIWVSFSFVITAMLEFAVSDFFNDKKARAKNKPRPPAIKTPQIYENHNNNTFHNKHSHGPPHSKSNHSHSHSNNNNNHNLTNHHHHHHSHSNNLAANLDGHPSIPLIQNLDPAVHQSLHEKSLISIDKVARVIFP
ncbi:gamma-aminobutyric acid receptor subunit rho-2-like, partial [Convolutriloba macropyga]